MASALMSRILRGSVVGAVAALGLSFAAQAQPYNDQYPDTYSYDAGNGITVYAHPYRAPRASNGAPIETVTASRIVPIDDLDLGTGYGRHIMRERVRRAATEACRDLDMIPGYVPDVGENDSDCYRRTVDETLANAPVVRDTDYYGY